MDALKMNLCASLRTTTIDPVTRCREVLPSCSTRLVEEAESLAHSCLPPRHKTESEPRHGTCNWRSTLPAMSSGQSITCGASPRLTAAECCRALRTKNAVGERRDAGGRLGSLRLPRRPRLSRSKAGPSPVQFSAEVPRRLTTRTRLRFLMPLNGEARRGGQGRHRHGDRC